MILDIQNLNKTYSKNLKKIHALKNITLKVEKNKILGVLGPNGAGKTTLLKIIAGIARPDKGSGRVMVLGSEDIAAVRRRIGFLPENPEFLKNITALELLSFSLRISGLKVDMGGIDRVLKQVGLYKEKFNRVRSFSKGMRQRIGIAQAIIHDPELLILDEPVSGLDPSGRRMAAELIREFHAGGKTVLLSSHNLDDIEILCTDAVLVNQGEIRLEESMNDLRGEGSFLVELWDKGERKRLRVESEAELWRALDEMRGNGSRIIRVQSGVPQRLESYYD